MHRPFRAIPEPEEFINGAVVAIEEGLVRSGYDVMGRTYEPRDEELLRELADQNARRPGCAGIELTFVEAPTIVGFGTTYAQVLLTVYDPKGRILLAAEVEPYPARTLRDLLLPRRQPAVDGRYWADRLWRRYLVEVFPPRPSGRSS